MQYYRLWIYSCNGVLGITSAIFAVFAAFVLADVRLTLLADVELYHPTFVYGYVALLLQCGVLQAIGCLGAQRLSHKLLSVYWILLLLLTIGDVVVGIVWVFKLDKIKISLRPYLSNEFLKKYSNEDYFTETWNIVQSKYHCCGVDGPLDFHQLYSDKFDEYSLGEDKNQTSGSNNSDHPHVRDRITKLIQVDGDSKILVLPKSCCTVIDVTSTVSSDGSSSNSIYPPNGRPNNPSQESFATSARLLGSQKPRRAWTDDPTATVRITSSSRARRKVRHYHGFTPSTEDGTTGSPEMHAVYKRSNRELPLSSFKRRLKNKANKSKNSTGHIDANETREFVSNEELSSLELTREKKGHLKSNIKSGSSPPTQFSISFACQKLNTTLLPKLNAPESKHPKTYATPEAFTLLQDELPATAPSTSPNNHTEPGKAYKMKVRQVTFRSGCATKIIQWIDEISSVLFIFGFCIIGFVKLCFLVILRCEIHEMIEKIQLLETEGTPPTKPRSNRGLSMSSAIPHPQQFHNYVTHPLLSGHRASTVSAHGYNAILPTIRSPDHHLYHHGGMNRGFNRNYYMRRASTNVIGDRHPGRSHSQETVSMTLLVANVEHNKGLCSPRRSSHPTSNYTLHSIQDDEQLSSRSHSRLSMMVPVPSTSSKGSFSVKCSRNNSRSSNFISNDSIIEECVTQDDEESRDSSTTLLANQNHSKKDILRERGNRRKISLPAPGSSIGQYLCYHPDSYTYHRAPYIRNQLKSPGVSSTSSVSPQKSYNDDETNKDLFPASKKISATVEVCSQVNVDSLPTPSNQKDIIKEEQHVSQRDFHFIPSKLPDTNKNVDDEGKSEYQAELEDPVVTRNKHPWSSRIRDSYKSKVLFPFPDEVPLLRNGNNNATNTATISNETFMEEGIPLSYLGTAV